MALVDWFIVIVIALAVLGGLQQGFFRSVCSLGGLLLGLVLAAWNYGRLAVLLMPLVRIDAVANTIAFVLIALLVMAVAGLIGTAVGGAPGVAIAAVPVGTWLLGRLAQAVGSSAAGARLLDRLNAANAVTSDDVVLVSRLRRRL